MKRRYPQKKKKSSVLVRALALLLVLSFAFGSGMFIRQLSKVLRQNGELNRLDEGIEQLRCDAVNYQDCIAQYRDPEVVRPRAESFGMIPADAEHTRIVSLPNRPETGTTMNAENKQP